MTTKQDWHHQVENERLLFDEVCEMKNGRTIRIDHHEENDTIYKTQQNFEKQNCTVSPMVSERKKWRKFGDAINDPPGVNSATTKVGDEFSMDFLSNIDDDIIWDSVSTILGIKCRRCKGGHLSVNCPHKDHLPDIIERPSEKSMATSLNKNDDKSSIPKYIPPAKRPGWSSTGNIIQQNDATIRVSNLSEETQEDDLRDLFNRFGQITRIYVPKDKANNTSKGFAFVTFTSKRDAQIAMGSLNGYGYDHLILKIEWAENKSQNYN